MLPKFTNKNCHGFLEILLSIVPTCKKGERLFYQFDIIHQIFPIKNVAFSERINAILLISCKLLGFLIKTIHKNRWMFGIAIKRSMSVSNISTTPIKKEINLSSLLNQPLLNTGFSLTLLQVIYYWFRLKSNLSSQTQILLLPTQCNMHLTQR